MRAVRLSRFGAPEELVPADVADPVAGPGEALIEVAFANVTFVETQIRAGRPPNPAMAPALPVVPGNGVGGVVDAVGPGVDQAWIGTRVVASTGGSGAYADRAAVDAAGLIAVPDELELDQAVALLADGRTALGLIRTAAVREGELVLVEAAAGGVGSLLVQLAAGAGARVLALAGGSRKLDLARELGADVAIDYTGADWQDRARTVAGGVDVAFDGVGGAVGRGAFELVRPAGRFLSFGMASGAFTAIGADEARERGVSVIRGVSMSAPELRELAREALDRAAGGGLHAVVGQRYPLARAADAHAAIEARATVGKTLLVAGGGTAAVGGPTRDP